MTSETARPSTSALAALGRTAGGVAHDVDNALTAIVTHATLIKAGSADVMAHAEAILRAARAASGVVERIRGALRTRVDAPGRVQVEIDRLLDDVLVVVSARAAGRVAVVRGPTHLQAMVAGQPAELLQMLVNLGNNAVDASPTGETVVIDAAIEGGEVLIEVRDRGAGMPDDVMARAFDAFFTTKGAGGTGLGLALARSVATSHGGTLELETRVASGAHGVSGTNATIRLPIAASDVPAPAPATDFELTAAGGGRVLLVDDDRATREALATLIDATGFEVDVAHDVTTAIQGFHRKRPDVVVTDLQLGDEDGGALIAQLLLLDPRVSIVVASGVAGIRGDEPWRAKVASVFEKPISPGKLIARLRELVARRQAFERKAEKR